MESKSLRGKLTGGTAGLRFAILAATVFLGAAANAVEPTITILGNNPETVLQNTTYVDAGATAFDPEDGNLTGSIVTANLVNTAIPGAYTVTYQVTDSEDFTVNAVRNVTVTPNTPPTITVVGANPVNILQGASYSDAGATANDAEDGNLTSQINTSGSVNTNSPGSYTITYSVTDSDGNTANASRTVNVGSNTPPTITVVGANPVNILQGASYSDAGATANDAEDGNLTSQINTSGSVNTNSPGSYTITYSVTDSDGNTANASRTVNVGSNTPPTITVVGANPVNILQGASYSDAGATANDAEDGNLTSQINTSGSVNTNSPGSYTITYSVTDSDGNTANASRTVNVGSNTPPTITVVGANPVNILQGASYSDAGATANDAEDGNLTSQINTSGSVNTNSPGSYTITYSVTDSDGNTANASRTVNVGSNTPPTITVVGANPVNILQGASYSDAGATANDAEDGNLTSQINTSGSVNTNSPGSYTITYSVTDSDGNTANASRTVNVGSNTPPTITVVGANPVNILQGASYSDAGATANDAEDGNLTSQINTSGSVNTNSPGSYTITYSVTDSDGKHGHASRTVNVGSNTPPTITVVGANPVNILQGASYSDAGATANDAEDGNLTSQINTSGSVNTNSPGSYTITYSVTDSDGNTANASRTVNVGSNTPPTITVVGANPVNILQGASYSDAGATANDAEDGNLTSQINVTNNVDTSTAGDYTVVYEVTDSDGNSVSATRNVTVDSNTRRR